MQKNKIILRKKIFSTYIMSGALGPCFSSPFFSLLPGSPRKTSAHWPMCINYFYVTAKTYTSKDSLGSRFWKFSVHHDWEGRLKSMVGEGIRKQRTATIRDYKSGSPQCQTSTNLLKVPQLSKMAPTFYRIHIQHISDSSYKTMSSQIPFVRLLKNIYSFSGLFVCLFVCKLPAGHQGITLCLFWRT